MGYYVIHGDCNGCNYYLKVDYNSNSKYSSFEWRGLKDHASRFLSKEKATEVLRQLNAHTNLPLKVVNY